MSFHRWLRNNKERQTSEWSPKDVQRFFREQDLEEVAIAAKKAKLAGKQLLKYESGQAQELAQLYAMLGVTSMSQKKKLRSAVAQLRQQSLSEEFASPSASKTSSSTITKVVFALSESSPAATKVSSSSVIFPIAKAQRTFSSGATGSGSAIFATPCASGESTPMGFFTPDSSPSATPTRLRSLSDPESDQRSPAGFSKHQQKRLVDEVNNLSEAAAFLDGNSTIAVKAVLRRRRRGVASADREGEVDLLAATQRVRTRPTPAFDDVDVSLLRLDARSQLRYADLMAEVKRVHGSAARSIKVKYTDADGDEVTILGDDSLRYAYRDWRQRVRRAPRSALAPSWRLYLEEDAGEDAAAQRRPRVSLVNAGFSDDDEEDECM